MNLLIFIPLALLIVPFIPTFIEIFKRKDRGPREIPEQTTYEETPELESELPEPKEEPSEPEEEAKSGISRLRRAQSEARTKITGDVMRITGNVSIPDGTEIKNHLMVQGNLKVGKNTHIYGSIKAFGDIELGEKSIVEGHVLSEGKVVIGRHCVVKGIVDSLKDIILKENATVEAVSTEKTVRVGPNAKINRRILSGTSIVTLPQQLREEAVKPEEIEPTPEIKPISEVKAEEKPQIPAGPALKPLPPPSAEEKPAVMGGEIPFEYLDPEVDHLYLYAPTRYGKTYLIRNYIIPRLASKKKIVVIDNHREYPFEPYTVNYDKTIPNIENDLFKTFITFNIWGDIEGIIEDMINHVEQAKGHVSIRPNIIDDNVERLIMSEFLKRMTQIRWKVPILLVIEEADKYDVLSAVTRGRHANMQVILTSAKRLMPEVFSNAHLVLGSINPTLIRDYDPFAAEAVAALGRHEFIWEKNYHDWRRFKLSQEPTYQPPSSPKPRIVEEEKPIEKIQIAQIIDRPSLEETMPEPDRVTENIFEYLEERIKMLEESKLSSAEPTSLEKLTSTEAKVLKAAYKCESLEEICLRFLMDPIEVEEAISNLIEKGYLDKDLKPKIPISESSSAKETVTKEDEQTVSESSEIDEKPSQKEQQKEETHSENTLVERQDVSKIGEEHEKKMEKEKEPTTAEEKIDIEKINFIQKLEDNTRDVLKEWKKVSSLLWRESKPKSADDQSVSDQSIKVDETPVEKTIEPEKKEGKTNRKLKEKAKSD